VNPERGVSQALLVRLVRLVYRGSKVNPVNADLKVREVSVEKRERGVRKVIVDKTVHRDHKVSLDHKVLMVKTAK
jgi:hypothetical protein